MRHKVFPRERIRVFPQKMQHHVPVHGFLLAAGMVCGKLPLQLRRHPVHPLLRITRFFPPFSNCSYFVSNALV